MSTIREQPDQITPAARESRPAEVTEMLDRPGRKTGGDLMARHASPGTAGDPAGGAAVRSLVGDADIEVIPLRSADEKLAAIPAGTTVTVTTSAKLGLDRTLEFVGKAARAGYSVVPHLGLAAPMQVSRLLTLGPEIGVGSSVRYLAKQRGFIGSVLKGGAYRPESLLLEMGEALTEPGLGVEGLHLFSFNQVEQTARWQQRVAGSPAAA